MMRSIQNLLSERALTFRAPNQKKIGMTHPLTTSPGIEEHQSGVQFLHSKGRIVALACSLASAFITPLQSEAETIEKAIPYSLPLGTGTSSAQSPIPVGYSAQVHPVGVLRGWLFTWNRGAWHSNQPLSARSFQGVVSQRQIAESIENSNFPPGSHFFVNTINYIIVNPPQNHSSTAIAQNPMGEAAEHGRPTHQNWPSRKSIDPSQSQKPLQAESPRHLPPPTTARPDGYARIVRGSGGWQGLFFTWQGSAWRSDKPVKTRFDSSAERSRELHRWTQASAFPAGSAVTLDQNGHAWIIPRLDGRTGDSPNFTAAAPSKSVEPRGQNTVVYARMESPSESGHPNVARDSRVVRTSSGLPGWVFNWTGERWISDRPLRTEYSSESELRKDLKVWISEASFPKNSTFQVDTNGFVLVQPPQ